MTEPTADSRPIEQAPPDASAALDVAMLLDGEFETVAQVLGLEEPPPAPPAVEPTEAPAPNPAPPEQVAVDPPAAAVPDEPPAEPEPVAREPAEACRTPDEPPPQPEPVATGAPAESGRVGQVVVTVLKPINYPLRLVPEPARPLVDWMILSLVFWVPVTWAIVMMIGGSD